MESSARLEAQFAQIAMHGLVSREARRGLTRLLETVFRRLVTRLKPAAVVEIGAHEASFSAAMKHALPGTEVIAFEANPEVFDQHAGRLAALGVDYRNNAIADSTGELAFGVPVLRGERKTTHAGLLALRGAERVEQVTVSALTLDSLSLQGPLALWIDVEGALRQVLGGASESLRNTLALYAELDTAAQFAGGMQANEAIAFFESQGFVALARDAQKPIQFNAIFVKRSICGEMVGQRALIEFYAGLGRLAGFPPRPEPDAAEAPR